MGLTIDILRPDDLLALTIETQNLSLDATNPKKPMLVVSQSSAPAYLIVTFPPQSIVEEAYFETGTITSQPTFNQAPPGTPPLGTTSGTLSPAGSVPARLSGPSRLVFQLPKGLTQIPYQVETLLDWSKLTLVTSPIAQGKTIQAPSPLETALELPYRLVLSPSAGVAWVNAQSPVAHSGRTELWHTRLARIVKVAGPHGTINTFVEASLDTPIPLRAVWSPDFPGNAALPSAASALPFLAALSARDRAQIVILTSGASGYYVALSQGQAAPWTPTPIQASRLFLSALGGWLSSSGRWSPLPSYNIPILRPTRPLAVKAPTAQAALAPVTKLKAPVVPLPISVSFSVESLDLGEWDHLATQGRDHYVKVVYEGFLYPFGHRASLVKVTERKFVGADQVPPAAGFSSSVTAYLRQHMYIVVREPTKSYTPSAYTYGGREMPFFNRISLRDVVTPDIDQPASLSSGSGSTGTPNSFWINVNGAKFQFHVTAEDLAGASIDFLAPLIFVSQSETDVGAVPPNTSDANSVQSSYLAAGAARVCAVNGKKVAFADPSAGDTTLKTTGLYFDTQILFGPPFPSVPFIPILSEAAVAVSSLEELLGVSTPVTIEYYQPYLQNGMDSNAGVFADIVVATQPSVQFSANRAGGFATPSFTVTALSARKGVVAGSADDAAQGLINPAEFFGNVQIQSMLFGTIPLQQLIPIDAITKKAPAAQNAPEIRMQAIPNPRQPTQIVTKVHWQPQLQDFTLNPVEIMFNSNGQQSNLLLEATITRMLNGSPSQSSIQGELSNFMLTLLGVIGVEVTSITFTSNNGSKTNVVAKLADKNPVQFIGPLSFIQTLANVLPPGIFGGAGPSIDLTSTEIKVSYTLGLPPISIGVFSLENIAITTGLDLPYLDGLPGFEFAFASRSSPFLLTVECLGGGGFVHLLLNANGIQMVEGSLEFGGEFSLDLGVASGGVHIMAGIYFQLAGSSTTLTGFVDIGGEVSVMGIISISIDLNLSLSYIHTPAGDKIQGRATLTISVSVLFFSISVQLSVERSFGNGSGDPAMQAVISAQDWNDYALAFAS